MSAKSTEPAAVDPADVETSSGPGGFGGDTGAQSLAEAARAYVVRVRGGDVGALPAILGLIVLGIIFTATSNVFFTTSNLANLPSQAAVYAFIGMGLVFVLLLGEIDLSAGTAAGVAAGWMGLMVNHNGNLESYLGGRVYWFFVLGMVAAVAVAVQARLWWAGAVVLAGIVLTVTHAGSAQLVAIAIAVSVGTGIGLLTGFAVSRIGIPSFVVTLALFIAWQGVLLRFIGTGAAIPVRRENIIDGIANRNVPPLWGWVFFVVILGGYGAYTLVRSVRRRAEGLSAEPVSLVVARTIGLAVMGGVAVFFLNRERGVNPSVASIKGMPYVVPIILLVMVFWSLILAKTSFGRHLYAVGGNTEAARRAGIDVTRTRIAAFALCSSMAAIGGVALASKLGGVPSDLGGGNTLLYSVGAAVIGGTSLFGGRGRIRDAVIGAVVIGIIPNGLYLLNIDASYNFMITGLVLLVAASVDALSRRRTTMAGH